MSPNPLPSPSFGPWHLDLPRDEGVDRVAAGIEFVRRALAEGHIGDDSSKNGAAPRDAEVAMDVVLVAAELLGNAERHGGGTRSVDVEQRPGLLRLIVCDSTPFPPRPVVPHRPERVGGHGLHIVARLSVDWGWRSSGPGKAVWADLPVPASGC